jgi:hypothetical protein
MNPLTQSKNTTILPILIALALGCFGLSPQARAACQEGCLTNGNTVLGDAALLNNTGASIGVGVGVGVSVGLGVEVGVGVSVGVGVGVRVASETV